MDFGVRKFRELLFVATCGMGAEFFLALADTVIAGNIVGEVALGGINLLQPIFNFVQFTAALIGTGTAIRYALEVGRLDSRRASEVFSQGFWTILIFGVLLLIAFLLGRDIFFWFIGADAEMTAQAKTYWNWYAPCTLLLPMTLYLIALVYADGDMLACAFGYGSLILGNIVASYFLCRVYGVAGCAMGTVVGNVLAVISLSSHFLRKVNTLKLMRHFRFQDLYLICKSSFADASVSLCWSLLFFLLANLVVEEFGSKFLPVLSVVLVSINLTLLFNGVSAAAQPIVGIYAGERNARGVRAVMNSAVKVAFVEGIIAALFFACFPQLAVRLVGIDDPELVPLALKAVRWVSIGFLGAPFVFLFNSYYLFVERYALAVALTFVADIVVYAALAIPAAHFFGMDGLWVALGISPVVAVVLYALFILFRYGPERFPLLLSRSRERHQFAVGFTVTTRNVRIAAEETSLALEEAGYTGFVPEMRRIVLNLFRQIRDLNADHRVHAEIGFDLNDGVKLCLRDDGRIADLSHKVVRADGRHFVTMGYNRYLFEL